MMKQLIYLFGLVWVLGFVSCVDQDFDEPPSAPIADFDPNFTIAELKALYDGGSPHIVEEDYIIEGIIISDDTEGNFFKGIYIQDETGGIEVAINQNNLQAIFQRGRYLLVKCKDLFVGDYNGMVRLGLGLDDRGRVEAIPETLAGSYVFRGEFPTDPLVPEPKRISQLEDTDLGTLIELIEVELSRNDFGKTYAAEEDEFGTDRILEDCLGNSIVMRNSRFADFWNDTLPVGNGSLVAVLSSFNGEYQLLVRDSDDVNMPNDPCNRSSEPASLISINEVRELFKGTPISAPTNRFIQGVVTSDYTTETVVGQNLVIQDQSGGIVLRFRFNHTFGLGEQIKVDITGAEISEYQGWLQVSNLESSSVTRAGMGSQPVAKTVTIEEILDDFENYESTLVKIENAEFDTPGTYSGGVDVSDETETIVMYTRFQASFASENRPTGKVSITAIVSQGGSDEVQQILIRDPDDVSGGNSGGPRRDTVTSQLIDFQDQEARQNIDIQGWQNIAPAGDRFWWGQENAGNRYAQATAFRSSLSNMETWLISPVLDNRTSLKLSFESALFEWRHDGLTVLVSSDYDGQNVSNATWTELTAQIAGEDDENNEWVPSGDVDLSSFGDYITIAFKYTGSDPGGTTSYRLDNIEIK